MDSVLGREAWKGGARLENFNRKVAANPWASLESHMETGKMRRELRSTPGNHQEALRKRRRDRAALKAVGVSCMKDPDLSPYSASVRLMNL